MTTIILTDEQDKALCEGRPVTIQPPVERFTCRPDNKWFCDLDGSTVKSNFSSRDVGLSNYAYTSTETEALEFEALRKQLAIQFEFLKQHAPEYKPDWDKCLDAKYYVYFNHTTKQWKHSKVGVSEHTGVYMLHKTAIKFCQMANAGLIEGLVP